MCGSARSRRGLVFGVCCGGLGGRWVRDPGGVDAKSTRSGRSARIRSTSKRGQAEDADGCGRASSKAESGWRGRGRRDRASRPSSVAAGGEAKGAVCRLWPSVSRAASASRTRMPCRRGAARWLRRRRRRCVRRRCRGGIDWNGGVEVSGRRLGVDALVGGWLGEVDGIGGGGGDTLGADLGELAQDPGKRGRQGTPGGSWDTRG